MSKISFSENHESLLIAFEEGKPLASSGNPQAEALKWAYSLGSMPTDHVIVVGLGSGFHIEALADLDPHLKITVVESRESLVPVFKAQFSDIAERVNIVVVNDENGLFHSDFYREQINDRAYVLSFQQCWGLQARFFSKVFAHLTGRSVESIQYHFEEFGIDMKVRSKNILSIDEIYPEVEASAMAENKKQIFRVLNELVK
ncbi:MAG: hypothetical protein ACXVCP_11470 [Bdellovibrio sp.]